MNNYNNKLRNSQCPSWEVVQPARPECRSIGTSISNRPQCLKRQRRRQSSKLSEVYGSMDDLSEVYTNYDEF
jgi:hypothetical protein